MIVAAIKAQLLEHLHQLKQDYTLGSYVVLRNYHVDADLSNTGSDINVGTAYYDVAGDRMLYTNRPDAESQRARSGGVGLRQ